MVIWIDTHQPADLTEFDRDAQAAARILYPETRAKFLNELCECRARAELRDELQGRSLSWADMKNILSARTTQLAMHCVQMGYTQDVAHFIEIKCVVTRP